MKRNFILLAIIFLSHASGMVAANPKLTYEQQILQALQLTRPEMITQIQDKFSNAYSNAPVMQEMMKAYIQEQMPTDIAKVYASSAQKYVSENDLKKLIPLFNEPQYRKCIDSVAILRENAWDIVPQDNTYWEQRLWVDLNIVMSLNSDFFLHTQQFDSIAHSLMDTIESKSWWTEEWLTKFGEMQVANGFIEIGSKTLISLMPNYPSFLAYISTIDEEKMSGLAIYYLTLLSLSEAPEWYLVASSKDLDYYLKVYQREEYQHWSQAQADFFERFLNMDASFWCELATDMYNYMKVHFPNNKQELQQLASEAQAICDAAK